MSNNTQLVNMQQVEEKICEQIKVSFFEMLPDDVFKKMIDNEINRFFEVGEKSITLVKSNSNYNGKEYELKYSGISPFTLIIWTELLKVAKERLKEVLEDPEFNKELQLSDEDTQSFKDITLSRQDLLLKTMTKELFSNIIKQSVNIAKADVHNSIVSDNISSLLNIY